jgi:hypothetical protein
VSLDAFFAGIAPLLRGECTASELEDKIGPSPSGSQNLAFYSTLVARNYAKILREVFTSVREAANRSDGRLWARLVGEYSSRTRVVHHDPNEFGREFPEWLCARRETRPKQSPLLEELADYQWIRHLARHAPDSRGLGMDERLFIRHYTFPVPRIAARLWKGAEADLEQRQPTTVLLYREAEASGLRYLVPTMPQLGVLIELATGSWPPTLELDPATRDEARAALVKARVLASDEAS